MKKFYLVIIATLFICNLSYCQWVQMPGPRGVRINVFYKNNNFIFAGTQTYGVLRSSNNGNSWEPANIGIEHTIVYDIISSGNNLLAGVANTCGINSVYKSTDNGMHWTTTSGLGNKTATSFAIKGSYVYGSTLDQTSSIYRSSDNGDTWQQVPSPINDANKIFVSGNAIIVSEFNFIWISNDDGATWEVAEQFALSGIHSYAIAGNKIFAAGLGVLYSSNDNGASWSYIVFPGGAYRLAAIGNTIYVGNGKISKSTDAGNTWSTASNGLGIGEIRALLYDGVNVFAGTANDTSGIYISTNEGVSWNPSSNGLPFGTTIRSMISIGQYVFAGMQADGVYRSTDDGITWSKMGLNNDSLSKELVLNFCTANGILYAAAANGIYKSTDLGITFTRTVHGFSEGYHIYTYSLTSSNNNIVVSVDVSDGFNNGTAIFYSSNNGDLWNQSILPADAVHVSSVASDGNPSVFAGVYTSSFSTSGLYKSTNSGVTFFNMHTTNSDIDLLAVKGNNVHRASLFTSAVSIDTGNSWFGNNIPCGAIFTYTILNNYVFAGNCEGMYYSTNQGLNWIDGNNGFVSCPKPSLEASCANSKYLFVGADDEGVWRRPLSDFGISKIEEHSAGVDGYNLSQNFPNPFNPMTKINFTIPKMGFVILKVYDMSGKEVAVLLNNEKAAGNYTINFDGSDLSSGIYFYKLTAGEFSSIKKMSLVK